MSTKDRDAGRWVYTTACPKFVGDTDIVAGYYGNIHAGWQDSPVFGSAAEFYEWAKHECGTRNALEASAPELLEALKLARHFADLWADEFGSDDARAARDAAEAAIAKAESQP